MEIPRIISDAQALDFGLPITGYLCCASVRFPCLIGIVFLDRLGRFEDGGYICTSWVQNSLIIHGLLVCETVTGSRYVVCHWLQEDGLPSPDVLH